MKDKEHTFVIYNGIVTAAAWVFRRPRLLGWAASLEAPAVVLTSVEYPADLLPVRLVLSDGTERRLVNATINGSAVELAELVEKEE